MHLPALLRRQRRMGVFNELELAPSLIRSHLYRAFYFHGWRRLFAPTEPLEEPNRVPSAFEALARLQREHGFAVLVAIFPSLEEYDHYGNAAEHVFVHALAGTHGFEVLDLLATFDACSDGRGETLRVQPNDLGHFDARGHECAATAIARYIERSHELPAR
jgi:hypothetical protein